VLSISWAACSAVMAGLAKAGAVVITEAGASCSEKHWRGGPASKSPLSLNPATPKTNKQKHNILINKLDAHKKPKKPTETYRQRHQPHYT
jgi:hypothetical protein